MWTQIAFQFAATSAVVVGQRFLLKRLGAQGRADLRRRLLADGAFEWAGRCRFGGAFATWAPVCLLVTKDVFVLDFASPGSWQVFQVRRTPDQAAVPGWFVIPLDRVRYPIPVGQHVEVVVKWLWDRPLLFENAASGPLLPALKAWEAKLSPGPPDLYR